MFELFRKKKNKSSGVDTYIGDIQEEKNNDGSESLPSPTECSAPEYDTYYAKGAAVFRVAGFVSTGLLLFLIIFVLTVYSDVFTEENFKYLIKNLDKNSSEASDSFETVYFPGNESELKAFRGDIALCAPGIVKIYDYRGTVSLDESNSTESPVMLTSDKYLLIYDSGDKDYYIYNSFSRLNSGSMANNIITAYICDDGGYCIVTESIEYASEVYVYDKSFNLISEIRRNDSISCATLSDDGKYLSIGGMALSKNGIVSGNIYIYDTVSGEYLRQEVVENEIPLSLEFGYDSEEKIYLSALTDKSLIKITENGREGSYVLKKTNLSYFALDGDIFVYSSKKNSIDDWNDVIFVNCDTLQVTNSTSFSQRITDVALKDGTAYILTTGKAVRIDGDGSESSYDTVSCSRLVPYSSESAFAFFEGRAEFINFN